MPTTRFDQESIVWPPVSSGFRPIAIFASLDGVQADEELWVPSSGRKIVLMGFTVSKETAGSVSLKGDLRGAFWLANLVAGENLPIDSGVEPFWVGGIEEKMVLDTTGLNGTFLTLWGHEDDTKR